MGFFRCAQNDRNGGGERGGGGGVKKGGGGGGKRGGGGGGGGGRTDGNGGAERRERRGELTEGRIDCSSLSFRGSGATEGIPIPKNVLMRTYGENRVISV